MSISVDKRDIFDRAREWVDKNHPDAKGQEWDLLFAQAVEDMLAPDDKEKDI